jgi:DNA-binding HxlR family transcriptional regulator
MPPKKPRDTGPVKSRPERAAAEADPATVQKYLRYEQGLLALRLLGDRSVFLILRDTFLGPRRFEELRRRTGASRGTLSSRLKLLAREGILYRNPYRGVTARPEYRLTDKGLALWPVMVELREWESSWGGSEILVLHVRHIPCGRITRPMMTCVHCHTVIDARDVSVEPGTGLGRGAPPYAALRRRKTEPSKPGDEVDTALFHTADVIGDIGTGKVLVALFFGLHRYDDLLISSKLATNILANRLRRLLVAGVVSKRLYQAAPRRFEYRLTEKGWALYPSFVALHEWATKWLPGPHGPGVVLRHKPCGKLIETQVVCNECLGEIRTDNLRLDPVSLRSSADARSPARARPARA